LGVNWDDVVLSNSGWGTEVNWDTVNGNNVKKWAESAVLDVLQPRWLSAVLWEAVNVVAIEEGVENAWSSVVQFASGDVVDLTNWSIAIDNSNVAKTPFN
jgi:hypothetical protein